MINLFPVPENSYQLQAALTRIQQLGSSDLCFERHFGAVAATVTTIFIATLDTVVYSGKSLSLVCVAIIQWDFSGVAEELSKNGADAGRSLAMIAILSGFAFAGIFMPQTIFSNFPTFQPPKDFQVEVIRIQGELDLEKGKVRDDVQQLQADLLRVQTEAADGLRGKDEELERVQGELAKVNPTLGQLAEKVEELQRLQEELTRVRSEAGKLPQKEEALQRLQEELAGVQAQAAKLPEKEAELQRLQQELARVQAEADKLPGKEAEILRLRGELARVQSELTLFQDSSASGSASLATPGPRVNRKLSVDTPVVDLKALEAKREAYQKEIIQRLNALKQLGPGILAAQEQIAQLQTDAAQTAAKEVQLKPIKEEIEAVCQEAAAVIEGFSKKEAEQPEPPISEEDKRTALTAELGVLKHLCTKMVACVDKSRPIIPELRSELRILNEKKKQEQAAAKV